MSTQLSPFNPLVTQRFFAESAGLSLRVVEGWVIRGYLPTIKIGKHRLINVAVLVAQTNLESLKKVSTLAENETVFQVTDRKRGRPKKATQIARNSGIQG